MSHMGLLNHYETIPCRSRAKRDSGANHVRGDERTDCLEHLVVTLPERGRPRRGCRPPSCPYLMVDDWIGAARWNGRATSFPRRASNARHDPDALGQCARNSALRSLARYDQTIPANAPRCSTSSRAASTQPWRCAHRFLGRLPRKPQNHVAVALARPPVIAAPAKAAGPSAAGLALRPPRRTSPAPRASERAAERADTCPPRRSHGWPLSPRPARRS